MNKISFPESKAVCSGRDFKGSRIHLLSWYQWYNVGREKNWKDIQHTYSVFIFAVVHTTLRYQSLLIWQFPRVHFNSHRAWIHALKFAPSFFHCFQPIFYYFTPKTVENQQFLVILDFVLAMCAEVSSAQIFKHLKVFVIGKNILLETFF